MHKFNSPTRSLAVASEPTQSRGCQAWHSGGKDHDAARNVQFADVGSGTATIAHVNGEAAPRESARSAS